MAKLIIITKGLFFLTIFSIAIIGVLLFFPSVFGYEIGSSALIGAGILLISVYLHAIIAPILIVFTKLKNNYEPISLSRALALFIPFLSLTAIGIAVAIYTVVPHHPNQYPCSILNFKDYQNFVQKLDLLILMIPILLGFSFFSPFVSLYIAHKQRVINRASNLANLIRWQGLIVFIIWILILFVLVPTVLARSVISEDWERISFLQSTQKNVETFFNLNGKYPKGLAVSDTTSYNRWKALEIELNKSLANDPCTYAGGHTRNVNLDRSFDYASSADRQKYVLKGIVKSPLGILNEGFLSSDADGKILGIWCGEQDAELEYCLTPDLYEN